MEFQIAGENKKKAEALPLRPKAVDWNNELGLLQAIHNSA